MTSPDNDLVKKVKRAIGNHAHRWDLVACQDAAARAAIAVVLEEAAKVAVDILHLPGQEWNEFRHGHDFAAKHIAAAIRALNPKER